VRKITESAAGTKIKERVYLGAFELYREYDTQGNVTLARETLHVMDDKKRIALVETKTVDNSGSSGSSPSIRARYQFDNHLGTACLELDETSDVISYEEYYPYGCTSYQSGRSVAEVSQKRYRYTFKERDEETGFYYHGARHYAPWLGRWTSCDPIGLQDGPNLYEYCDANPIIHVDSSGKAAGFLEAGLLESGGSRLVAESSLHNLWNQAVNKVLGAAKEGETAIKAAERNIRRFESEIRTLKETVGPGSNRKVGTAIYEARKAYSRVRTEFGALAKKAGISLEGVQLHHGIGESGELAKAPEKALDAGGLHLTKGNAGTPGSGHNKLTELNKDPRLAASEAKNKAAAAAKSAEHEVQTAAKTTVDEVAKESVSGLTKETATVAKTALKETAESTTKTTLKEGGKLIGTKAAKFIPFVGIAVGVGLVANDLRTKDYKAAAWDTAEAIPVVGDVVGAFHAGLGIGTLLNEGLGIEKVASEHGMAVESAAKKYLGAGETTARILGATTAALSSITVAPNIALKRMIAGWF
jgi:RHS repeat-associated protein